MKLWSLTRSTYQEHQGVFQFHQALQVSLHPAGGGMEAIILACQNTCPG